MGSQAEDSVRNLQELYTVAVGAALTLAVVRFVPETGTPQWNALPVLVGYVVTLVPFYHGAMRHLDTTYREKRVEAVREGALLGDFFLLFIEACFFLALASVITNTRQAAWTFLGLIALDGLWGIAAHWVFSRRRRAWAEIRWSVLNIFTALVVGTFIASFGWVKWLALPWRAEIVFAAICFGRTIADYSLSWRFYFPKR